MALFHEWHDFVTFPLDPSRVRSMEQRLDTANAVDPRAAEYDPSTTGGARVSRTDLQLDGEDADQFEAMEVTDYGDVAVWTRRRVWCLRREAGLEKLIYLPRHPPILPR